MDDSPATLDPTTLTSETTQEQPAEKANLPTETTSSTTVPAPLVSETTALAAACKLAQAEPRRQFLNTFLQFIHEVEFEFGFSTPADEYVREALDSYGTFAREWINELFVKSFNDPFVMSAILRVIAHFDYQRMYPQGMTMAAAATAHADTAVRECGVRCFENWEAPENLKILRSLSFSEDWLMDYLSEVILDLERLANHVVCR